MFGFQGQERDDEVYGIGNALSFEYRVHDPRLGRWLTLDQDYKATQSNYVFARNNPVIFIDIDGKDDYYYDKKTGALFIMRNGAPHRFYMDVYLELNDGSILWKLLIDLRILRLEKPSKVKLG